MGQVIIRNLEDSVIASLKVRARDANTSLEQHLRDILTEHVQSDRLARLARLDAIRGSIEISGRPPDLSEIIRQARDARDRQVFDALGKSSGSE